jgi:hypothetical protein
VLGSGAGGCLRILLVEDAEREHPQHGPRQRDHDSIPSTLDGPPPQGREDAYGAEPADHQGVSDSALLKRLVDLMLQGASAGEVATLAAPDRTFRDSRSPQGSRTATEGAVAGLGEKRVGAQQVRQKFQPNRPCC